MSRSYETFRSADDILDYEAMQSDRAYFDRVAEERFRDAEINFGLEGEIYEPEPYYADEYDAPAKPRCQCSLCTGRVRELPAAIAAQSETRAARKAVA